MKYAPPRHFSWAVLLAAALAAAVQAQSTFTGIGMPLHSVGQPAGSSSWVLDRNGYVGAYIQLPAAGNVTIGVNALGQSAGGIAPRMSIVVADSRASFDVAATSSGYEHTFSLPAGTYFVRTELNNDLEETDRDLTINDFKVSGATLLPNGQSNTASNNFVATEAANTYIQNFRRGDVSVALTGAAVGAPVDVSLKRIGFNFGTAVGGSTTNGVNNYLGNPTNTWRTSFQQRLNQNFNALVLGNGGKWGSNEAVRNSPNMGGVDVMLNYAADHNMQTRMHNLIWGDNDNNGQQPSWVLNNTGTGLLDRAAGSGDAAAAADLRNAISSRINYYVGDGPGGATDRATRFNEIDIYNESYHTGETAGGGRPGYWNVYGAVGIADIYHEVQQAITDAGSSARVYVNEYNVLGDSAYADWYVQHIESLRRAGLNAGLGDVVDGIGAQYYPSGPNAHSAAVFNSVLQNLAVQGLPLTLTEFGVAAGATAIDSADILESAMRLAFGNPDMNGFFMWGFDGENGTNNLFAPAARLYDVTTNFNNTANWTITPAGQRYEWLFGDGPDPAHRGVNPNPWDTQLSALVGADGRIHFNGFYGDYELTLNGRTYRLSLVKGQSDYSIAIVPEPAAALLALVAMGAFAVTLGRTRSQLPTM